MRRLTLIAALFVGMFAINGEPADAHGFNSVAVSVRGHTFAPRFNARVFFVPTNHAFLNARFFDPGYGSRVFFQNRGFYGSALYAPSYYTPSYYAPRVSAFSVLDACPTPAPAPAPVVQQQRISTTTTTTSVREFFFSDQ